MRPRLRVVADTTSSASRSRDWWKIGRGAGGAVVVAAGLAGLWYLEFSPHPERQSGLTVAAVIMGLLIGVRQWLLQARRAPSTTTARSATSEAGSGPGARPGTGRAHRRQP
jgi:hypothetical protein